MSPRLLVETTATGRFFRKTSKNKKGIEHQGRDYKLYPGFKKEEHESTITGRNYGYKLIFQETSKLKKASTATVETTSYIQISKKSMVKTTAT